MTDLYQVVYASAATENFSKVDLKNLLAQCQQNNSKINVTGMLLYCEGNFLQVIEGDLATLDTLYQKILGDPRHEDIIQIFHEPIATRAFGDWSMGYQDVSKQELENTAGLYDFFASGSCILDLEAPKIEKIIAAFSNGRWHAHK